MLIQDSGFKYNISQLNIDLINLLGGNAQVEYFKRHAVFS